MALMVCLRRLLCSRSSLKGDGCDGIKNDDCPERGAVSCIDSLICLSQRIDKRCYPKPIIVRSREPPEPDPSGASCSC